MMVDSAIPAVSSAVGAVDSAAALRAGRRQAIGAAIIGNILEWYDFSAYAFVATIIAKHPGRVIGVHLFTGSADLVSTMTVSGDGFHPSDAGYQLIADRFAAAIRASGIPLR